MKKYFIGVLLLTLFSSCEDIFESKSSSLDLDGGEEITSTDHSIYSVMGILSQIQQLGERYVLLGELRGDLMEATSFADYDLQEISSLNISEGNSYRLRRDYYNVINNCNVALERMDTSVVYYQDKILFPEFAAVKAMRAWTWWQMALTFGEVQWSEKSVLSLDEALADMPVKSCEEVARFLVQDLIPFADEKLPDYGTVDGYTSSMLFVPIQALLGDLYLYLGDYEKAALAYYSLIENRRLTVTDGYANNWQRVARPSADNPFYHTTSYVGEALSGFVYSSSPRDYHPSLVRLAYNANPSILPASHFVESMDHTMHFYAEAGAVTISAYLEGDLRGRAVSSTGQVISVACGVPQWARTEENLITKYNWAAATNESGSDPENEEVEGLMYTRLVPFYRTPQVYLRFAEALNRLGKPSVAFAVLKYGLTADNLSDPSKVNQGELNGEPYLDFSWLQSGESATNRGTACRGRGRGVSLDRTHFVIPDFTRFVEEVDPNTGEVVLLPSTDATELQAARADSILFVEDCIVDELAAETCFEGGRFFDLLCIARHRNEFPGYMAEKVSARFADPVAACAHLMDERVWFLK